MTVMDKHLGDLALDVIRAEGSVEIARSAIPGVIADWLDDLIAAAASDGLELTWTLQGDTLTVLDIEA